MRNITSMDYMENIIEQIKSIDVDNLPNIIPDSEKTKSSVIEEQKIYFWIRLHLKDECNNIEVGDDVCISYTPSGEELKTKFVCYGKTNINKDYDHEIISYNAEDDKKVLCLMVDENVVNYSDEIPFIRTLFKTGRHYEYQLMKRSELLFIIERNNFILDYFDCDF